MKRWLAKARVAAPLLALAIFLLNTALTAPLFMPGELPFRGSIEGGYVGMARFLSAHPNPWGWNPLPYCGLPTQFMYVPVLPYLTALWIRLLPHVAPDLIYRTIVSLLACLGPVTLFWFALFFTGSRRWSFAMAAAYSLISLSYALFPAVEKDRGIVQLPWRIQVLAKYGEGPHNVALTLLPLALLALWKVGQGHALPGRIVTAALLLAAIPLTNWVGALGLAISCALLVLAASGEPEFRLWPLIATGMLAYLLACFWLTPSFIRIIAFNWPADSFAYQLGQKQELLLAAMVVATVALCLVLRWLRASFYLRFTILGAFVFGFIATAWYVYGVDTLPESRRYAIEFELFLALAICEALRLAMRSANSTVRLCAIGTGGVFLLVSAPQLWAEATQGWKPWELAPVDSTVEYKLAEWIAQHPPQGRVFASGGLRFRLNEWFDIPQVGGPFETGLRNRVPVDLAYRIRSAASENPLPELAELGAAYVVVHGPKSREYYRDFRRPDRLNSRVPAVFHIEDDTIYQLPPAPLAYHDRGPLAADWKDASTLVISSAMPPSASVSVRVNADPGWRATQEGRPITIAQDSLGFLQLSTWKAAETHIELHYRGTLEQRLMAGLSAIAWLVALGGWALARAGLQPRRQRR